LTKHRNIPETYAVKSVGEVDLNKTLRLKEEENSKLKEEMSKALQSSSLYKVELEQKGN